ncbi:MAG TPA: sulfite oxidase [Fimbriimonadaceae bacterium]|nr:sulfite oxidase [Fimbriimonadaceae bacterium]
MKRRPDFHTDITRREALGGLAALPLMGGMPARLQGPAHGQVVRERDPENLEYPFETLKSYITPNEEFYVRSHFKVPTLEVGSWRLEVGGAVATPLNLTFDDLVKLPAKTVTATLECAGNSRVFLAPTVSGAQWELGAVSNAEWTGVPLSAVLEKAGVSAGTVEVILVGADTGLIKTDPKPPNAIHFARSIPIAKAMAPEVLLAYKMNGETLPLSHGFPVRALVPGWYGVASVKWLTRIVAAKTPFSGHFQTVDYAYWEERDGIPNRVMITEMLVKAEISRPTVHELLKPSTKYLVTGAAWTSTGDIAKVEVSADGGASWADARLTGESKPFTWRLWEFEWTTPATSGKHTLMSRATDSSGRTQPMTRDANRANYLINHVLPIDVIVR